MNIAMLTTLNNPWGLEMIKALTENNIYLSCVICSVDYDRDQKIQKIISERTGGLYKSPDIAEITKGKPVPSYFVKSHNEDLSERILRDYKPDIIVLGGADIIKENVLNIPNIGTINIHPGLLPEYRGCSAVEWAIYNDDHVGASCHFVTLKIDAGKVIYREIMPIYRGDTYEMIRSKMFVHGANVLVKAILRIRNHKIKNLEEESNNVGDYYKTADHEKVELIKRKLLENRYGRYSA